MSSSLQLTVDSPPTIYILFAHFPSGISFLPFYPCSTLEPSSCGSWSLFFFFVICFAKSAVVGLCLGALYDEATESVRKRDVCSHSTKPKSDRRRRPLKTVQVCSPFEFVCCFSDFRSKTAICDFCPDRADE